MNKINMTIGGICTIIGLFLGITAATITYGRESGILQQKVHTQEETLKDLKAIIADIHQFQFQMLRDTGEIKEDVAVLKVMIEIMADQKNPP